MANAEHMESLIFLGMILGIAGGVLATLLFYQSKSRQKLNQQSNLLLEKIKEVSKLITVEGEFSEIFTHREAKKIFFNLLLSEKKALIIIKAKVLVGFDLTKIKIDINKIKKEVMLSDFPSPEILSIETDLEYFDMQKGIISKFSEVDLTDIHRKAKDFIRDKAGNGHLMQMAQNQSTETLAIIHQLIEAVGWKLVSDKNIENPSPQKEIKAN